MEDVAWPVLELATPTFAPNKDRVHAEGGRTRRGVNPVVAVDNMPSSASTTCERQELGSAKDRGFATSNGKGVK
eukprot:m.370628 g.370628  ORF g.370628 m.370628 type:complete len:74 (+) comp16681_c1_seq1:873-1094(+)